MDDLPEFFGVRLVYLYVFVCGGDFHEGATVLIYDRGV